MSFLQWMFIALVCIVFFSLFPFLLPLGITGLIIWGLVMLGYFLFRGPRVTVVIGEEGPKNPPEDQPPAAA